MGRYTYYKTGNKIICVSHFAGKAVRGVAKCAPSDTFDEEFGKQLAKARCDWKVANKRYMRALDKVNEADELLAIAEQHADKMSQYLWDAEDGMDEASSAMMALVDRYPDHFSPDMKV